MNTPASDTAWGEPNRSGINWGEGSAAGGPLTGPGGDVEADARGDAAPNDTPASAGRISRTSSLRVAVQVSIEGSLPGGVTDWHEASSTTQQAPGAEAPQPVPLCLAPSILRAGPAR